MDEEFEKRANLRRTQMVSGVARSFEELDESASEFWKNATYAQKLKATHDALIESWIVKGRNGPAPRFDASTWGVLRFER